MSRRLRAGLLAAAALVCALASAGLASRYRSGAAAGYGELRPVVLVERALERGSKLRRHDLETRLGRAELPQNLIAPDALADEAEALGRRPANDIPAGSYLLGSQLRAAAGRRPGTEIAKGRFPIEVQVAGAAALAARGGVGGRPVDVVVADEPAAGKQPRVRLAARSVPLLELRRGGRGEPEGGDWVAILALRRPEALAVIEAENYARELRLIPR